MLTGRRGQGTAAAEMIDNFKEHYLADGKYQFLERLRAYRKEEGFELPHGAIYRGRQVAKGEEIVIKVILREYWGKKDHPTLVKAFYNEVQLMHEVSEHPGVLKLLDAYVTGTMYLMVMEKGKSGFEDKLNQIRSAVTDPKEFETIVRKMFRQVVDAVDYMHSRHIYHRDIKPANILVCSEGNDFHAITLKLIDFGIAVKCRDRRCFDKAGTLDYQAPEIFYCDEYYDPAPADVWSLGVMLVQMLAGRLPFTLDHYSDPEVARKVLKSHVNWAHEEFATTIPPLARDLLQRMLRPDPQDRYSLDEIKRHRWFRVDYKPTEVPRQPPRLKILLIPEPSESNDTSKMPEQKHEEWKPPKVGEELVAAVLPEKD